MKINLSGKTAIVTGSTAGIGYAIARGLAEAGAEVVANGRTAEAVERAVATLTSEVARAMLRGVAAAQPTADILVNNVGIYGLQGFFEIHETSRQLADPAGRDRRGSGQYGRLCRIAAGLSHHRRGAPGGWRGGRDDRLRPQLVYVFAGWSGAQPADNYGESDRR